MENKIDQFFKNKLEGHSLPPLEEAWGKVEANLSKKNNVAVWRIAAAILIAAALVSVLIWSQPDNKNNEQMLAAKKSPKDNSIKEKNASKISSLEKNTNSDSTPKSVSSLTSKKSTITKSPLPRFVSPQTESKSDQKESDENKMWSVKTQTTATEETKEQIVAVVKESIQNEKIKTEATSPTTIASTKRKPIKLEFTLDDFSSEQPMATVNEEKNTGLKKVWEMAIEIKNGNGRVREIKNEIFALNFKKNKNQ